MNQFSDDEIGGAIIDGKRGRAFGLGPQISIDIAHGKGGIVLKYQREFGVRNRAQGDKFWFELAVPI
ncbi:hypothetical protein A2T82_31540 [Burkholderia cenocepacia]|nr:hypothetical protein A2T82_31540 [Burkholderia cenocepacia]